MNQKEAKLEAKLRWGPAGDAEHISHEDPNWRFVVGRRLVNARGQSMLLPLGSGRDFTSAFIAADYQKERRVVTLQDGRVIAEAEAADVLFESEAETRERKLRAPPTPSYEEVLRRAGSVVSHEGVE